MTTATQSDYGRAVTWSPARPKLRPLRLLLAWVVSALALLAAAWIVPGATVNGFWGALVASAAIAVLNAVLPPLVAALRLPFVVALGLLVASLLAALILLPPAK